MTTVGEVSGAALRGRVRRSGGAHVRGPRWLYWLATVLVIFAALAVVIRVVVDPVATHYTRKGLKEAKGITVDFQRVHVTLLPPGYEIRRFKMREGRGSGNRCFTCRRLGSAWTGGSSFTPA